MNTEQLTVAEALKHFSWSERLVPDFKTEDKVINTDGPIQIYKSHKRGKDHHIGHAQVQIKGVARQRKHGFDTISHSAKVVDLKGYLKEGGLILIKGLVDRKARDVTLFYIILTPFKILDFLKQAGANASTTLLLRRLPNNTKELESIALFSHAAQREDPNNYGKSINMRDGYSLQIVAPTDIAFNGRQVFDRSRGALDFSVLQIDENGLRTPIDAVFEIVSSDYFDHDLGWTVTSGNARYENVTGRRLNESTMRATLSAGLFCTFVRDDSDLNVSVTISNDGSVAEFLKDGRFYLGCLENKSMTINSQSLSFDIAHDASEIREIHDMIRGYQPLFEALSVDMSLIPVTDLTEQVQRELYAAHRGLLESEEIEPTALTSGRYSLDIGEKRIELLFELSESTSKWIIHNPYSPDFSRQYYYLDDGGERAVHFITPYDVLTVDDIERTLNLNLQNVVASYAGLSDSDRATGYASDFALKLFTASDRSNERREEFLSAAEDILHWLDAENPLGNPIFYVNSMQAKARRETIDETDESNLRRLRRNMDGKHDDTAREIAICCSILLRDIKDADERLTELSNAQQLKFKEWPIYALTQVSGVRSDRSD